MAEKLVKSIEDVTIRFAGDSGDGMQLTGTQFTDTTALFGNDLSTLPDYPSEIRAPSGTTAGVSGFQLHFSSDSISTPGDTPDVLIAMNPAALKVNLKDLKPQATIITNISAFDKKNLELAGYEDNPVQQLVDEGYNVLQVPMTKLTLNALEDSDLSVKEKHRCKNFFALGLMYWMYSRPIDSTIKWIDKKFANKPGYQKANKKALQAGYNYGETTERLTTRYFVEPAKLPKGKYKNVSGNEATALGFVAASYKSGVPLFQGSYPITPASEILQELSKFKRFGVKTYQAEDEIAAICATIGASYAGSLAVTTTSGPGLSLKSEAMGLGVMTELPMVIVNVMRGGPSTGLPTKTEQSDLLQALYGRNGEAPLCVLAASTPADCFMMAYYACQIAIKYMTPVLLLTDGYLANGSEPMRILADEDLPDIEVNFRTDPEDFYPYTRDINLARPWAKPGTPGLEHRVGGLEKSHIYGNVSHVPENHEFMVNIRAEKIKNIVNDVPDLEINGEKTGKLLVLGWGSTYGAINEAVARVVKKGYKVSQAHLRNIYPLPANTKHVLESFDKVLVPELNLGQMAHYLRSEICTDVLQFNKVQGQPFKVAEIENKIISILGGDNEQ